MTFTFDPKADYFELFEACLEDGTTEALSDPEDFDEFVQALKDGRYDPETGIAPAPWTAENQAALVKHIEDCCAVNNGWYASHFAGSVSLWAFGEFTKGVAAELREFPGYLMPEDIGRDVSPEQYLLAAREFCQKEVTEWNQQEDKAAAFSSAFSGMSYLEERGSNSDEAVAALLKRQPEWTDAAAQVLLDGSEGEDITWELVLASTELRELLKDQLVAKLPEIDAVWNEGSDEAYDWLCFGEEVAAFVTAAGIKAQPKETSHSHFIRTERDKSLARGIEQAKEREAAAAKELEEAEPVSATDVFNDAMGDCYFDEVFADAERFKQLILDNIDEIASNFSEDNEFEPTGDEPEWLIKALLDAGALVN